MPRRRRCWVFPRRPCSGACTRPGSCWRSGWRTCARPRRPVTRRQLEEAPPIASHPLVHGMLMEMLELGKTPEEVCRDCPDRLPEVRQRWRQFQLIDAQVRSLLPGLAPRPAAGATEPPVAGLPQVPGYEVEGVLGRGGMGVVYKARHLALKRTVALKMLATGHPHSAGRARFLAEAEAVARLQHPSHVQIQELGWEGVFHCFPA